VSTLPPGTRIYLLLRRWVPVTVSHDVLEPAVADLQHEAGQADTPAQRRRIVVRGHLAIARALLLSIEPAGGVGISLAPRPEQYTPSNTRGSRRPLMAGHEGERRSPHPIT